MKTMHMIKTESGKMFKPEVGMRVWSTMYNRLVEVVGIETDGYLEVKDINAKKALPDLCHPWQVTADEKANGWHIF